MQKHKSTMLCIGIAFLMLLLIMDAKTALGGASEGIALCIRTVIPSLFPFFFLSGIANSLIAGRSSSFFRPIGRLCGIPEEAEYLLIIGLTGGYPVGAQCISKAYKAGSLSKHDAQRMLGFCSNAGPAFIFGMMSQAFDTPICAWALWLTQMICAIVTGWLLPKKTNHRVNQQQAAPVSPSVALQSAIKAMATVCGWVVIFRVLIAIFNRWILWLFSMEISVIFSGFLELSNGCVALRDISDPAVRYIAASAMLSCGGICVGMQTQSVCQGLSCKTYFIGKTIQTLLSVFFSIIFSILLFPGNHYILICGAILLSCVLTIFVRFQKYTGNSILNSI